MDEILKGVGRKGWVKDQALGNVCAEEQGLRLGRTSGRLTVDPCGQGHSLRRAPASSLLVSTAGCCEGQ